MYMPESRSKQQMYLTVDTAERKIHYRRGDSDEGQTISYEDADLLNGLATALVDMRMK